MAKSGAHVVSQSALIEPTPANHALIVEAAGLGYEVDVPMSTFYNLPALGERVTLLTHFVVREDAQLLYGFLTQKERAAVRELIKISGVGPKLALSVLSGLNADELAQCVALQDAARLTKVRELAKNYLTPAARTQRQTRRCLAAGWRHTKQCRGGQRCTQCAVGVGLFRKGSAAGAQTAARGAESGRIDPTGVEGDGGQITSRSRSCGCCTSNENGSSNHGKGRYSP